MDIESAKNLAYALEQQSSQVMQRLTHVLRDEGFEGLEIVAFSAASPEVEAASFGAAPCPTVCRVLPDGSIRCEPSC